MQGIQSDTVKRYGGYSIRMGICIDMQMLYLTEDGIQSVSYKETEHYQITKQFLNAPEQMCKYLFSDD